MEQKTKDKVASGKGKKTNVQDEVNSILLDEVSQPKPPSKRGINRYSSHLFVIDERFILGPIVVDLGDDADVLVDELIINLSLALFI